MLLWGAAILVLFLGLVSLFAGLLRDPVSSAFGVGGRLPQPPVSVTAAAAPPPAAAPAAEAAQPPPEPSIEPAKAAPAPAAEPLPPQPVADAAPASAGRPRIAIVLTEVGADPALVRRALAELPPGVTLAVSPDAAGLAALTISAKARGQEIWLGVPMQPVSYPKVNPGPRTLLVSAGDADNQRNLEWALNRAQGYVGLYNITGSAFMADRDKLRLVMAAAAGRGLKFLDAKSGPNSQAPALARALNVPLAINDRFVEDGGGPEGVRKGLDAVAAIARKRGSAIALVEMSPVTLQVLPAWLAGLEAGQLSLAPASALTN